MTTKADDLSNRKNNLGSSFTEKEGLSQTGFSDPNLLFPKPEYVNQSGVNKASRGENVNNLNVKACIPGTELGYLTLDTYEYTQVQVDESSSGHVIEINDTPSGERILIKHNCGAGIDIQPDGTILINSTGNRVEVVSGNHNLAVEADGNILYNGNLNMTVTGDYTLDVKGDYHVKVGGNNILKVIGSYRKNIVRHMTEVIQQTKSSTVLMQSTNTLLGDVTNTIKGTFRNLIKGKAEYFHSGITKFTSESGIDLASVNVNMAADNMTCIGTEGTMGGKGMISYTKNLYVQENIDTKTMKASNDIKANVVHADLDGLAATAEIAGWSASAGRAPVPAPGGPSSISTEFTRDTTETGLPDAEYMEQHLRKSQVGYRKVNIDEDQGIKDSVDQTTNNGGVSDRELNIQEVRSKLKNKSNKNNSKFILNQTATGVLSSDHSTKTPPNIGRVRGSNFTTATGSKAIGSNKGKTTSKRFVPSESASKNRRITLLVEPKYDVNKLDDVSLKTKLNEKISISKFVASLGDPITLQHIDTAENRKQIARNLMPHVFALEIFHTLEDFSGYSLVVAEGLYKKGEKETITPDSLTDLKTKGRAIAYELYNSKTGKIDLEKTFDLATYLKDNIHYDKLILYYDTYDEKNDMPNAQIVVTTPEIPEDYASIFDMKISSVYNNEPLSENDLIEVPDSEDEPEEKYDADDVAPDDTSGSFASEAAPEPEPEPLTMEERKQIQEDQYLARPYGSKEVAEGGIKRTLNGKLFPNRVYSVVPDGDLWKIIRVS